MKQYEPFKLSIMFYLAGLLLCRNNSGSSQIIFVKTLKLLTSCDVMQGWIHSVKQIICESKQMVYPQDLIDHIIHWMGQWCMQIR